ncbi:hypothetical protein GP486_004594 [Trichoglossum hirsutum]|uniref:CHAT domain-containing protein n=1 Tax=Trichoglossum hirsutum TaxID=265104 RepID=A0A9P8LAW6_9PEZI|nr:hypothetical protein GP486_004594 [Trichoglossum hirsutum]
MSNPGERTSEGEARDEVKARLRRELGELQREERIGHLERQMEEARMRAQRTSRTQESYSEIPPAMPRNPPQTRTNLEAGRTRHMQASNIGLHTEQADTGADPTGYRDRVQREFDASADMCGAASGGGRGLVPRVGGNGIDMGALALEHYRELSTPAHESVKLLFYDMDLEELRGFVRVYEDSPEQDVRQTRSVSSAYYFIFLRTGAIEDLQNAINTAQKAMGATHINDPNYATHLSDLVVLLANKYEHTSLLEDLERAILRAEEVLTVTPPHHPDRPPRLMDLIKMKWLKSLHTHSHEDFDEAMLTAIDVLTGVKENTVGRAGEDQNQDQAAILNGIAASLSREYQRTGSLDQLQKAIDQGEEAISSTPRDHTSRASMLANLCGFFASRFERTGDLNDLQNAIDRGEEAVSVSHYKHPDIVAGLNNLATPYARRYRRTGEIDDLQRAIDRLEEAVVVTPVDNPDQAVTLNNLGTLLGMRFERTGAMGDLERAIEVADMAVAATPVDHPDRAGWLNNLGILLGTRLERTGGQTDVERSLSSFEAGWNCRNAQPSTRIKLARKAVAILASQLRWEESSKLLQNAMELLHAVSPRSLEHTDKQYALREFAGLASVAAAIALNAGKEAHHALKLLELGRGVISGLLLEMRSDISALREQHAELAKEFTSLRDELDSPTSERVASVSTDNASYSALQSKRFKAAQKFDDVIVRIRALPEFKNFLLPPTSDELMEAAEPGPIVIINLNQYRCDAFLIERYQIRSLRLPDLYQGDVEEKLLYLRSSRISGASSLRSVLEWLWHAVDFPCLQALGLEQPPSDDTWPRVWWIPTGALSHFPLHAAGLHRRNSTETVLDRVVSSYSPSVKSLLYVRRTIEKQSRNSSLGEVLLASMRSTPKQSDLRFAEEEVKMLDDLLPASAPRIKLSQAHKEAVLSRLTNVSIFHFAGHGKSDPDDPLKSCLLLSDWQSNPLTVEDLMSLNLHQQKPRLAYLSACSTGESKHVRLYDESLHLVNACQLAGFQHVIGSLWEVSDMYSVDVARIVYETVKDEIGTSNDVALGVHKAARLLRGKTSPGGRRLGSEEGDLEETLLEGEANGAEDGLAQSQGDSKPRNGNRDVKLIKTARDKEDDEIGNPLIWAAYIHVGT